jgi:glycosyltransferase involved in cell wall biosynthesis
MSKLSIITINYNNLEGLKKTVECVVNQTWRDFQYIVIDGGSTDGSAAYIESQSEYIDYWVSEPDKGIYNAMNKGIVVAAGEYLLFLNSGDDLKNSKSLKEIFIHLEFYDIIYFDINVVGIDANYIKKCPEVLNFNYLYSQTLPHQSTFVKRELFKKVGYYDENLKIVSDWKFFIMAIVEFKATYKYFNTAFSTFYLGGLSSQYDYSYERNLVIKEYFKDQERLLRLEAFLKDIKNSKSIKLLQILGLLKFINKANL